MHLHVSFIREFDAAIALRSKGATPARFIGAPHSRPRTRRRHAPEQVCGFSASPAATIGAARLASLTVTATLL
jgi:hypothetical protein